MADQCSECYSFKAAGRPTGHINAAYGTCRVRPPLSNGGWPAVNVVDWCGEFSKEKPKEGGLLKVMWAIYDMLANIRDSLERRP